jgi:hypothetical protein
MKLKSKNRMVRSHRLLSLVLVGLEARGISSGHLNKNNNDPHLFINLGHEAVRWCSLEHLPRSGTQSR